MKKILFLFILIPLLINTSCGRERDIDETSEIEYEAEYEVGEVEFAAEYEPTEITPLDDHHRRWTYDIMQFRDITLRHHPIAVNTRIQTRPENIQKLEDFDEIIFGLLEAVPTLTDFEIATYLQWAAGTFRDNHFTYSEFWSQAQMIRYPLGFRWFSDGIFVMESGDGLGHLPGLRLVAINGHLVEDMLYNFVRFGSVETIYGARRHFASAAANPLVLQALEITDRYTTVYTFEDTSGVEISIHLGLADELTREREIIELNLPQGAVNLGPDVTTRIIPITMPYQLQPEGEPPLFMRDPEGNLAWTEFIKEYGVLYIRVLQYIGHYEPAILAAFHENDVNTVIIDARGNPGGGPVLESAFRAIAGRMDEGALLHIIDEGSASAALEHAALLYSLGAVIIGQPSGQAMEFYGFGGFHIAYGATSPSVPFRTHLYYSNDFVLVPNSFSDVQRRAYFADGIFRPHVLICYNFDDWMNNRDPFLEYALGRID